MRVATRNSPALGWKVTAVLIACMSLLGFAISTQSASACPPRHAQLSLTKVETGSGAPGATYTFTVENSDHQVVAGPVEISAGDTWTSAYLPLGTYTVHEAEATADTVISPNPVVLALTASVVEVTVTNPFPAGKVSITKVETGDTAPGAVHELVLTPVGGSGEPVHATVAAGTTWTSGWLPLGSYTITEVDAPEGATITPNPVTLTEDGQTVTVTATNPYRDFVGSLSIAKVETGDAAPGGTYTFTVSGPTSVEVEVTAGATVTIPNLPLGSYTITEVDAPEGATITPNPVTLTEDGQTVTVTATNPFSDFAGDIAITKVETGGTAPGGTYTFSLSGPMSVEVQVKAGTTVTVKDLPLGTYTIVEENAPTGATIVPNPVTLTEDGQTVSVIATNPYATVLGVQVQQPQTQLPTTGGEMATGIGVALLGANLLLLGVLRRERELAS